MSGGERYSRMIAVALGLIGSGLAPALICL
jgi:hypothetical protein